MAKKVPDSLLREWNDGDVVFAKDYKQERRILQTAINDNWDRMIKQYRVLDPNGGIIETQNLDTAINTIRFKEGKYITLALDTDTSTLTIETRAGSVDTAALADDAVSTSKIQNGAVSTIKIADLSITAQKLADGSVTGIKLGANSVTEGKIADNSIRGSHIQDGTITIEKLDPDIFSPVESAEMAAHRNATPLDHPHGSVTDQHIGTRTVDDGQEPTGNTSFLSTLVSWLANRIRAITGETSWRTAPATTLKAIKAHMDNKSNPHGTTKEDVGLSQLVNERQASKSAFDNHVNASNPHSGSASTTALNNHANDDLAHNATPSPFANRIMSRDGNGRAAIADPTADSHIANKRYVDDNVSSATANVAKTNVDNNFTTRQTVKNGETYQYIGVRRDVNDTEYGAEVAVSAGGNAQLSKRENGNIIASISLYSENDARIANNRIWHEGNLSNPARADGFNSFNAEQQVQHNGLYMLDLERIGSTNPARFRVHLGHGRFNISPDESTSNTTFTIAQNGYVGIGTPYNSAGPSAPFHVGVNAQFDGTVTVGGTQVALQNGNYANLRARATTKADVGLSNVTNHPQWHNGNQGNPNNLNTASKQIVGSINELFTTVSNGKQAIRDAIADAGGTPPSGSPSDYTFQELANTVSTVNKYAEGRTTFESGTIQVRGLHFRPEVIKFTYSTPSDIFHEGIAFGTTMYDRRDGVNMSGSYISAVYDNGFDFVLQGTISDMIGRQLQWEAWGS